MIIYFIVTLLLIICKCQWIPKIVWTYWDSPFGQDQHFLKAFTENHKRILNNSGWEYRFLNIQSVKPWIKDMKEVVQALQRPQFKNQHVTRRANLIRLALINYYGGVWIDYSTALVQNFDWLYRLKEISLVQNIYGDVPKVFMTYNSYVKQPIKVYDPDTKSYFFIDIRLQTSFMAAQPNTTFLKQWLGFFIQAKRIGQQKLNQGIRMEEDNYIVDTAVKQKIERGSFPGTYFQFQISILITLQRKQRELDKAWSQNGNKGFRKLAMKQYQIWVMPFQKSIFFSASIPKPLSSNNLISYLFQWEQEYLKQNQLEKIYPIKTVRPTRDIIFDYFNKADSSPNCPQLTYMNKDSLFYKYLLKDYPIKFTKNVLLDKYAARLNIGFYCPKFVFDEKRRIQLQYTSNGLGSQIGKVFDGVYDSYYVDIEIEDQSTLSLFTKGWRRVQVRSSQKNINSSLFSRETDKFVKLVLGEPDSSISPPEKTTSLAKFCKQNYEMKPTFLNVGKVGVQRMVLYTNDWDNLKCRPEIIQIKDTKNQANYLQHESLLLKHDYVLLRDYRLNENERVSQIFVTKEKEDYYRRHYKEAHEREAKNIGVVKFSEISKFVEDYYAKFLTENKIISKEKPFYHFSQAGHPLVISDILKDKTVNSKQMPVFVFEFDPESSEVVVSAEYNKSTVSIQYLQFLKLEVKQQGSIYIFDPNSRLADNIKIQSAKIEQIPKQQKELGKVEDKYKNALKRIYKKSTQQYKKLNERMIFLYCLVMTLCIICMINFVSSIKAKNKLKRNQNSAQRDSYESAQLTQQQSQRKNT